MPEPSESNCDSTYDDLMFDIQSLFGISNESAKLFMRKALSDGQNSCHRNKGNTTLVAAAVTNTHNEIFSDFLEYYDENDDFSSPDFGQRFHAYVTPLIIIIGIVGNITSLCVFVSRRLRGLSASHYLAALSASDTIVLIAYVFLEWLNKGLPRWPGNKHAPIINVEGICHIFLIFSYTFRFVSVYLIVVFTIERYIAVCKPLKRRIICTRKFAKKLIFMVVCMGAALSLPKAAISGIYETTNHTKDVVKGNPNAESQFDADDEFLYFYQLNNNRTTTTQTLPTTEQLISPEQCRCNPNYTDMNFILEVIYGITITAVPFVIMAFFNTLIMRRLIRRFSGANKLEVSFRETRIRWEFTVMLLVVSSCFIFLNVPYFIVWIQLIQSAKTISGDIMRLHQLRSYLYLTKTIFYLNYCINFFLYCLTGSYYRSVIKEGLFHLRCRKGDHSYSSRYYSNSPFSRTSQSMSIATQSTFV